MFIPLEQTTASFHVFQDMELLSLFFESTYYHTRKFHPSKVFVTILAMDEKRITPLRYVRIGETEKLAAEKRRNPLPFKSLSELPAYHLDHLLVQ